MPFRPPDEIIDRYADVLVNFALSGGRGVRRGEVVLISAGEEAKPLYAAVRLAVIKAGATFISAYSPSGLARERIEASSNEQLSTFHRAYYRGLASTIDHHISIRSTEDPRELQGIDTRKIMLGQVANQPYRDWMRKKEGEGRYSWTLALYATSGMAKEARLSVSDYWDQIIHACFLDDPKPIARWREVMREVNRVKRRLDKLEISSVHIESDHVDLTVAIGEQRQWLGGSGHNIPSFEIFTSPDWRGTEGTVSFNEPLYRYGGVIKGIKLRFERGVVVESSATTNESLLHAMLAADEGSCRLGEFSLTDGRLSRITRYMADTLYDENRGGPEGNFHVAVGSAYKDAFTGSIPQQTVRDWRRLGFNDSAVHTDIVSTERRQVTALLPSGKTKVIYKDGQFTV